MLREHYAIMLGWIVASAPLWLIGAARRRPRGQVVVSGHSDNRPAGLPPRPSLEPVRVQRRASNSGIVMVCGQKVALGRLHRWQTVTIAVSENYLGHRAARSRTQNRPTHNNHRRT